MGALIYSGREKERRLCGYITVLCIKVKAIKTSVCGFLLKTNYVFELPQYILYIPEVWSVLRLSSKGLFFRFIIAPLFYERKEKRRVLLLLLPESKIHSFKVQFYILEGRGHWYP
ncbi:hypothetical protein Hdeb2414_s0020g00560021 [Helianthus debilis subsp. tardiflorus]